MSHSVTTAIVNRHYFNLEDDLMQEIIGGWAVPDVEVFAPDLEPVCADPAPDDVMPPLSRSNCRHAARVSEHRVLPLALVLIARLPFAPSPRRAKVPLLLSHSNAAAPRS